MFVVSAVAFLVALVLLFADGRCENDCGGGATPALIVSVTVDVISGLIGRV